MQIDTTGKPQSLLQQIQQKQSDHLRQLASGKRVERASDDAAALQIIERLTAESQAYQRSLGNAYDGMSLLSVAEGGLENINHDINRIRELTMQAGNGALSASDRRALQSEVDQLTANIGQTLERTEFAGQPLLTQNETRQFQVGSSAGDTMGVELYDLREKGLSALNSINLTDPEARHNLLAELDTMSESITSQRAEFGAQQNAFLSTARNLMQTDVNTQAARSRLQDLDYAMGTANSIQSQILQNSALAMLGQANAQNELALSILG